MLVLFDFLVVKLAVSFNLINYTVNLGSALEDALEVLSEESLIATICR